jgi:AcrR family transcriptional regulator
MAFESETSSAGAAAPKAPRDAIIDALLALAAERRWEDISISDVAERAGVSLARFRDAFPSKGAALAGFSRRIDTIVLDETDDSLIDEPAKERLADILMRRLDAMAPYREGLKGVAEWARRDPLAAAALNRSLVNSMRFMLEAARIDTEGPVGALKTQGLALGWASVLTTWFDDDDPDSARTIAALDRTLERGGRLVGYAQDAHQLTAPFRALAAAVFQARGGLGSRMRDRWASRGEPKEETLAD